MSVKLINKVEKAKQRSNSVLSQFTETQERLITENVKLDEVKAETENQINKLYSAIDELQEVSDDIRKQQMKNDSAIEGINYVLNGNN